MILPGAFDATLPVSLMRVLARPGLRQPNPLVPTVADSLPTCGNPLD